MIVPFHPFPLPITPASTFKATRVKFIGLKRAETAIRLFQEHFPGREIVEVAEVRGIWRIRYV